MSGVHKANLDRLDLQVLRDSRAFPGRKVSLDQLVHKVNQDQPAQVAPKGRRVPREKLVRKANRDRQAQMANREQPAHRVNRAQLAHRVNKDRLGRASPSRMYRSRTAGATTAWK